jgi:hypothetical protein
MVHGYTLFSGSRFFKQIKVKKTVYFVSTQRSHVNVSAAISEAEAAKDDFVKKNENLIEEIDLQELKFLSSGHNNENVIVIISLTYYLKK